LGVKHNGVPNGRVVRKGNDRIERLESADVYRIGEVCHDIEVVNVQIIEIVMAVMVQRALQVKQRQ